ncbi:MAG TPA: PKD domain-containing protein, partial [Saprospiraceae bacterium]|nr:PKD domain-containing protein [Saprospiraceae bacterium]
PDEWEWDFGDGMTALGADQIRTYVVTGTYNVCLTVSNENGSHTSCQNVYAEKSSATTHPVIAPLSVYPNPFTEYIEINPPGHEVIDITLNDLNGHEVLHVDMTCPCRISLKHLPTGVYFYRLERSGGVESGKVLKIEKD